jgi:hypothetical protein
MVEFHMLDYWCQNTTPDNKDKQQENAAEVRN